MAKRGAELTQEQLHDKVRARIRAQNWYTRERVILSLIALYGVDTKQFFDAPPGTPTKFAGEDSRPVQPVAGVLDQDALACLIQVSRMFTGADHKLVAKIIRMVADWCDINVFYQARFRAASFVDVRQATLTQEIVQQLSQAVDDSINDPNAQIVVADSMTDENTLEELDEKTQRPLGPQGLKVMQVEDEDLDAFFGIGAPVEVIQKPKPQREQEQEPERNDGPAASLKGSGNAAAECESQVKTPAKAAMIAVEEPATNIVAQELAEDEPDTDADDGDDPFAGLEKADSDDDNPFDI